MTTDDKENPGNRAARDEQLLLALAAGATIPQAAKSSGVSESTARRRMEDPAFQDQLRKLRSQVFDSVMGQLTFAASGAVRTLRKLMADEGVSDTVRLGAARAILEHCGKLRGELDLEARIAELERLRNQK